VDSFTTSTGDSSLPRLVVANNSSGLSWGRTNEIGVSLQRKRENCVAAALNRRSYRLGTDEFAKSHIVEPQAMERDMRSRSNPACRYASGSDAVRIFVAAFDSAWQSV
jgi:hypothetical protein